MPLFECSQCKAVENTATSDHWDRVTRKNQLPLCSECGEGTWHGIFPKQTAKELGMEPGRGGFLKMKGEKGW